MIKGISTLLEEINDNLQNKLVISNISFPVSINNVVFVKEYIFKFYRDVVLGNCTEVDLGDALERLYLYRPKYLSLALYGTIDLWYLLLYINNMTSCTEFNKKVIKIYNPNSMELLNKIIEIQKENLLTAQDSPPKYYR